MQPSREKTSASMNVNVSACGATRVLNSLEDAINLGRTKIALYTRGDEQLLDAIRFISALPKLDGLDIEIVKSKKSFSNGDTIDGRYAIRFAPDRLSAAPRHKRTTTVIGFPQFRSAQERARRLPLAA